MRDQLVTAVNRCWWTLSRSRGRHRGGTQPHSVTGTTTTCHRRRKEFLAQAAAVSGLHGVRPLRSSMASGHSGNSSSRDCRWTRASCRTLASTEIRAVKINLMSVCIAPHAPDAAPAPAWPCIHVAIESCLAERSALLWALVTRRIPVFLSDGDLPARWWNCGSDGADVSGYTAKTLSNMGVCTAVCVRPNISKYRA